MKLQYLLSFVLWACVLTLRLPAQLDTLFFDDFNDNRGGWKVRTDKRVTLEIADGYLHYLVQQGRFRHQMESMQYSLGVQDSFLYELRIVPKAPLKGGLLFLGYRRGKKDRMVGYTSLFTSSKSVHCYSYSFDGNDYWTYWVQREVRDAHVPVVLRVTFGHGRYHFFVDGVYRGWLKARKRDFRYEWGWVLQGYNDVKVDYVVLMGRRSGNGGGD